MVSRRVPATSAADFLPDRRTLPALREAARACRGCGLYRGATQTVFGEGVPAARLVAVGEAPGNDEDLAGVPFVGPAGRLLDEGFHAAGIAREDVYVTNAVKHFKWKPAGKRRLHQTPSAGELSACVPWLREELALIRPAVLLCLGATAARALLGREFRVTVQHGQVIPSEHAAHAVATLHPSAILRHPTSEGRERAMAEFIADLAVVAALLTARR